MINGSVHYCCIASAAFWFCFSSSALLHQHTNMYTTRQNVLIFHWHRSRMTQLFTVLIYLWTVCAMPTHYFIYFSHNDSCANFLEGVVTQKGLWYRSSNSVKIFVQCTYPPSFIIVCLNVRKLSCWQTSGCCWQHPPHFAMLRRWRNMLN